MIKEKTLARIKELIKTPLSFLIHIWKKFRNKQQYYALNELDKKMRRYLRKRKGFFIELGANDGISQSNTFWFEKNREWEGILVEAIPYLAERCQINRPKCKVFNCACVSKEYPNNTIELIHSNLMSIVENYKSKEEEDEHIEASKKFCKNQYEIRIPARTLTSILNECNILEADFLSLDVEGYELMVLKGIDLRRYKIRYILIEIAENKEKIKIDEYLKEYYRLVKKMSSHDYLYKREVR